MHRLLDAITALSAPGSDLLVDFVGQSVLDSPAMRPVLAGMAERGMAWRYGTDDPEELLTGRGWTAEVRRYGEAAARLGRPLDPDAGEGYLVRARRAPAHCVG
ncbi:class I SAM-dependent methyltransferase [Saccharopolyspora rosea]|uniref:Uncharacterized protein n=1 Tax=Saccharopolyspora rosea TaxID=524884 RepID=A0ABW3FW96_9PSEU|nr:hypothetical protein [Saccharopolyspora rosea]